MLFVVHCFILMCSVCTLYECVNKFIIKLVKYHFCQLCYLFDMVACIA